MLALLIDPAIVLDIDDSDLRSAAIRWGRVIAWQQDDRSRLGVETFDELMEVYRTLVDGSREIPKPIRQSVFRSVSILLGRGALGARTADPGQLDPNYTGRAGYAEMLRLDILGARIHDLAVGTSPENWPAGTSAVAHIPAPPADVPLHFEPNRPTVEDIRRLRAARFANLRVTIIGGRPEARIVDKIVEELGIDRSAIRWIPCERHKKPRNLDQLVAGAAANGTVLICVTGRVGHSTSGELSTAATRRAATYFEVETANGIISTLLDL